MGAGDQSRRKRANESSPEARRHSISLEAGKQTLRAEGKKLWSRAHTAQMADDNPPATTHKTFSPFDQVMPKKRAAEPTSSNTTAAPSTGKRHRPNSDRPNGSGKHDRPAEVMVVNPGELCRRCKLDFCPGLCMWCNQRCAKWACNCEKAFYCDEATCSRSHWKKAHKKECADRIKRLQQAQATKPT